MARTYEDVKEWVVKRGELVELKCDRCGSLAEHPRDHTPSWEWGGVGSCAGLMRFWSTIDGEYEDTTHDLCEACSKAVAAFIESGISRATPGEEE